MYLIWNLIIKKIKKYVDFEFLDCHMVISFSVSNPFLIDTVGLREKSRHNALIVLDMFNYFKPGGDIWSVRIYLDPKVLS